jgi:alpha-beta hydrolase superfamily lysophospholipase
MKNEQFFWQSSDNLKLFGQEWTPDGKLKAVVCLVHGMGEHAGRYQHVAQKFTDNSYALAAMDLRGHGKSEGLQGHTPSYDIMMDDIQHLVNEAQKRHPGIPTFIYGHSMGGSLVLYYCLTRKPQLTGAIVTAPGLAPAAPLPAPKMFLARVMSSIGPTFRMANDLDLNGLSHDPAVKEAYTHDPLVHGMVSARLGMELINNGQWMIEHAAEFPIPLLLMQGTADRLVNPAATAEFAAKLKGDFTYKTWPGFYHELHNEPEKEEVFKVMLDWLAAHIK